MTDCCLPKFNCHDSAQVGELIDMLLTCHEYFCDRYDVSDNPNGEGSIPNDEMALGQQIEQVLRRMGHPL